MGEVSEEDLEVFRARRLRDRIYRLNMISYAVITVFVGAFGWYWWDSKGFVQTPTAGPFVLMGLAAVAYLVVRAFLFRNRQIQKELRRRMNIGSELRRNL
jgi:sulfite exporter TauE/SafE